ncbi:MULTISPECIES: methyltransferase [Colwellia]|uniref:Methyltransferase n=1 Tax=Colwellia marinimaniae TaxID=1513592 RepID=A0ABQ0MTG4_9GAMM|nr:MULTISPECIES: methyltransferase [Colwellia]GAW95614.1 methyltransferase [Colwellia marinimaniae]
MPIFELFLLLFFAFIALPMTVSIIFSTVKLGISPMPSSNKANHAMMQLIDETEIETKAGPIIDLGSGWGNFVIAIAKRYPHRKIVGYELSYLPWLTSSLVKKLLGLKNLTLHRQDFYQAELPSSSVLVCYLFPQAMEKISNKLPLELSGVSFVISNNFALPGWQASKIIQVNDFYKSPVYLYKISKR